MISRFTAFWAMILALNIHSNTHASFPTAQSTEIPSYNMLCWDSQRPRVIKFADGTIVKVQVNAYGICNPNIPPVIIGETLLPYPCHDHQVPSTQQTNASSSAQASFTVTQSTEKPTTLDRYPSQRPRIARFPNGRALRVYFDPRDIRGPKKQPVTSEQALPQSACHHHQASSTQETNASSDAPRTRPADLNEQIILESLIHLGLMPQ